MNKIFKFCLVLLACLIFASCRTIQNDEIKSPPTQPSPTVKTEPSPVVSNLPMVDLPKLAGKSVAEIDKILGEPKESKQIKDPTAGEYRVYQIPNHPKGLAIRFYGNRATSFNLILSQSLPTSKQTLKDAFGIEVGNLQPRIDPKEPLSEVWRGEFSGVKFAKIYAKRERENGGFIFVLAEIAQ